MLRRLLECTVLTGSIIVIDEFRAIIHLDHPYRKSHSLLQLLQVFCSLVCSLFLDDFQYSFTAILIDPCDLVILLSIAREFNTFLRYVLDVDLNLIARILPINMFLVGITLPCVIMSTL